MTFDIAKKCKQSASAEWGHFKNPATNLTEEYAQEAKLWLWQNCLCWQLRAIPREGKTVQGSFFPWCIASTSLRFCCQNVKFFDIVENGGPSKYSIKWLILSLFYHK